MVNQLVLAILIVGILLIVGSSGPIISKLILEVKIYGSPHHSVDTKVVVNVLFQFVLVRFASIVMLPENVPVYSISISPVIL